MPSRQPFSAYVAPARAYPQLWRLVLGLVICALSLILWLAAIFGLLALALGVESGMVWLSQLAVAEGPAGTLLMLSTFLGMAAGPMLAVRLLHHRPAASLFGPAPRVLRHFAVAAAGVTVLYAAGLAIWSGSFDATPNLSLGLWLSILPVALLAIAVQTGAEELLFRGYIMQQLAARFRSPLIYMLVPSLMFGMLHYDPATMGGNAWAVVGSTAFFGLIAADLTQATGSLGAAWGLHFANNVVAVMIVSTRDTITGLSLYLTPYAASQVDITGPLLMADMILVIAIWAVLRGVLTR